MKRASRGSTISAAELAQLNAAIERASRSDSRIAFENPEHQAPSQVRLAAIVKKLPATDAVRQAAWLLRAMILVQPFPDGNHRTGVLAADLLLQKAGITFRGPPDDGIAFQREVTARRYRLLKGYDDAPLIVLDHWDDEVMECCERFVRGGVNQPD